MVVRIFLVFDREIIIVFTAAYGEKVIAEISTRDSSLKNVIETHTPIYSKDEVLKSKFPIRHIFRKYLFFGRQDRSMLHI